MPRYIDADWLVQKIDGWRETLAETYGENDEYVNCLGEVLMHIDDAPTADVVEVVRCKDCRFYGFWEKNGICECWSGDPYEAAEPGEEDFCSFAERREDAEIHCGRVDK